MTMMQSESRELSSGTARQRRYRERKRAGVVCIARVPVYALDVEEFLTHNRLKPEDQNNAAKIAAVVEALVDDFTEGKLAPAGDEQR